MITLGKQGLVTFDRDETRSRRAAAQRVPAGAVPAGRRPPRLRRRPARRRQLTLAAGGSLQAAAFLGSIAAAIEVQEIGNVPVTADGVLAHLHARELRRVAADAT